MPPSDVSQQSSDSETTGAKDENGQDIVCIVCNDKSSGKHYGQFTCEGRHRCLDDEHSSWVVTKVHFLRVLGIMTVRRSEYRDGWVGCICTGSPSLCPPLPTAGEATCHTGNKMSELQPCLVATALGLRGVGLEAGYTTCVSTTLPGSIPPEGCNCSLHVACHTCQISFLFAEQDVMCQ